MKHVATKLNTKQEEKYKEECIDCNVINVKTLHWLETWYKEHICMPTRYKI
jgi:hypothetical protein